MVSASRTGIITASAIAAFGPIFAAATSAACQDYTQQYDDIDNKKKFGATDIDGDGCKFYASHPGECGKHDVKDFIAKEMCCSCGGGSTSKASRSIAINEARVFLAPAGEDCPGDFEPVTTLAACRASLDMISLVSHDFKGVESDPEWPKGCYYCSAEDCAHGVWFNKKGGKSKKGTQRICQKAYDPASVKILFVGDSDIDYWDSAPAFPGSFNVGVGGYETTDVIKEVDIWVEELDPKWVVLVIGENDIKGPRQKTKNALARFKTIVGKFVADGSRVIYMGTKPEPGSKDIYREYQYYDAEIRKFARSLAKDEAQASPPLQMVDVFVSFTSNKDLYNTDKLHMSRLGYQFWNAWVQQAMTSTDPCLRWREGVCMEAGGDRKPSADMLRKFDEGQASMVEASAVEVGAWKMSGAFAFVTVVGVAATMTLRFAFCGRSASALPQSEEAGLLEVDQ